MLWDSFFWMCTIKKVFDVFIVRELQEESGLTVDALEKVGNLKYEYVGDTQLLDVHVFRADAYNGDPTESEGTISTAACCPGGGGLLQEHCIDPVCQIQLGVVCRSNSRNQQWTKEPGGTDSSNSQRGEEIRRKKAC